MPSENLGIQLSRSSLHNSPLHISVEISPLYIYFYMYREYFFLSSVSCASVSRGVAPSPIVVDGGLSCSDPGEPRQWRSACRLREGSNTPRHTHEEVTTCKYIYIYVYRRHIYIYVYMYTRINVCACMYISVFLSLYLYMYIYIYDTGPRNWTCFFWSPQA